MIKTKNIIFAVDDDPFVLKFFKALFEEEYQVHIFTNGQEAYNHLDHLLPDIILSDIMMPLMNGFQFGKLLKNDERTKDIPLIYLSALDTATNISKCFDMGAVDYIMKPIDYNVVRARVNLHLSLSNLQKELSENNLLLQQERDTLEQRVEEKTSALREKDIQLIEMDRLVSTYTLAAGIAHEINTPLGIVKSGLFALKKGFQTLINAIQYWETIELPELIQTNYKTFSDNSQLDAHLRTIPGRFNRIERGIQRISNIVLQFQSFGRFETGSIASLDINQSIEETLSILFKTNSKNISINKSFSKLPTVECLSNDINQCLLQLLRNAKDAITDKGTITISTSYDESHEHILISIEDTGKGMSKETLRQAFHPFFTTKDIGEGTGLGLTITEKAIKSHGGSIKIDSEIEKGTNVMIRLPVHSGLAKTSDSKDIDARGGGGYYGKVLTPESYQCTI